MKTVFSNKHDLAHAWAHADANDYGRTGNSSLSFKDGVLFSYNTAIFKKLPNGICLENLGKYSVTTTAQQGVARQAWGNSTIVAAWENAPYNFRFEKAEILRSYQDKTKSEAQNLAKACRESTRDRYTSELHFVKGQLQKLLELKILAKKDLPADLKAILKLDVDPQLMRKLAAKEKARIAREHKKKENDYKEEIAKFRAGEIATIHYAVRNWLTHDLVRLKGENIVTSQGVIMPIKEALKLYTLAKNCRAENKVLIVRDLPEQEQERFKIGNYHVTDINAQGDARVGCHYLTFKEMHRCFSSEYQTNKQ